MIPACCICTTLFDEGLLNKLHVPYIWILNKLKWTENILLSLNANWFPKNVLYTLLNNLSFLLQLLRKHGKNTRKVIYLVATDYYRVAVSYLSRGHEIARSLSGETNTFPWHNTACLEHTNVHNLSTGLYLE